MMFSASARLRSITIDQWTRRAKKTTRRKRGVETIDGADRSCKRVLPRKMSKAGAAAAAEYLRQSRHLRPLRRAQTGHQIDQINTELVWELERKGEGWGEEIFPSLKQKRRVIEPLASRKRKHAIGRLLGRSVGFQKTKRGTFSAAAAWRIAARARALVDRKRMKLIAKMLRML